MRKQDDRKMGSLDCAGIFPGWIFHCVSAMVYRACIVCRVWPIFYNYIYIYLFSYKVFIKIAKTIHNYTQKSSCIKAAAWKQVDRYKETEMTIRLRLGENACGRLVLSLPLPQFTRPEKRRAAGHQLDCFPRHGLRPARIKQSALLTIPIRNFGKG